MTELKNTEFVEEKEDVVDAIKHLFKASFGFFSLIPIGVLGVNGNRIHARPIPFFFFFCSR